MCLSCTLNGLTRFIIKGLDRLFNLRTFIISYTMNRSTRIISILTRATNGPRRRCTRCCGRRYQRPCVYIINERQLLNCVKVTIILINFSRFCPMLFLTILLMNSRRYNMCSRRYSCNRRGPCNSNYLFRNVTNFNLGLSCTSELCPGPKHIAVRYRWKTVFLHGQIVFASVIQPIAVASFRTSSVVY